MKILARTGAKGEPIATPTPRKYGNVTVKDFRKYEKLECKKNKPKLDIDFLNNRKQLDVYLKFLIFKLLKFSNKDA